MVYSEGAILKPPSFNHGKIIKKILKLYPDLSVLDASNIVMHCSLVPDTRCSIVENMLGQLLPRSAPSGERLRMMSAVSTPASPFAHFNIKITSTDYGSSTFLLFNSNHLIRSGGGDTGTSFLTVLRFLNYLRTVSSKTHHNAWLSAISIPNSVYCGQFRHPIDTKIRESSFATYTSKFPGIAIALDMDDKITPELFLKASKFIVPGIKNQYMLITAIERLVEIVSPYFIKTNDAQISATPPADQGAMI